MTVHLVYPHADRESAPDVIGRRVRDHLAGRGLDVVAHDWDSISRLRPQPGDSLIGHPHPLPGTVLRRSWGDPGWTRRVVMSPFNGDPWQVSFLDPFVSTADVYLAITGTSWAQNLPFTVFRHWLPRFQQCDLAVDPAVFPSTGRPFAPPGVRRVLYIGNLNPAKDLALLTDLAARLPTTSFGWIGGDRGLLGYEAHGYRPLSDPQTQALARTYDFSLAVGSFDANPTTVLESLSLGLLPLVNATSGYVQQDGVVPLPTDADGCVEVLERLLSCPTAELDALLRTGQAGLPRFSWDAFLARVDQALDPSARPLPSVRPSTHRGLLRTAALTSPLVRNKTIWRGLARQALRRG